MGLTVAERLLDMMGGRLLIESCPDKGTTVTLQLPAFSAHSAARPEPASIPEMATAELHELVA